MKVKGDKMKNKEKQYYWLAMVNCLIHETGELKTSFLAFQATNRHLAAQHITKVLEKTEDFLDKDGKLRLFHLLELRQIRESEHGVLKTSLFQVINDSYIKKSVHYI